MHFLISLFLEQQGSAKIPSSRDHMRECTEIAAAAEGGVPQILEKTLKTNQNCSIFEYLFAFLGLEMILMHMAFTCFIGAHFEP